MDLKTSDRSCVPMCRPCHREFDAGRNRLTFEPDHDICLLEIVEWFNALYLHK